MTFDPSAKEASKTLRIEREDRSIVVKRHDAVIASSDRALLVHGVLEAPVYYVPRADVYMEHLTASDGTGSAEGGDGRRFLSVVASGGGVSDAAWTHDHGNGDRQALEDHVGFDPAIFNVTAG